VSLQGVEEILVGCGASEQGIAKARIKAANAEETPTHFMKLPPDIGQFGIA
jgi:hypothetical protein